MDNFEDLTQKERVEQGLLRSLLGQSTPAASAAVPAMAAVSRGGCGHCACGSGESDHRACGFGVEGGVLAAVWSPLNMFEGIYDVSTALRRGTMFQGLDKPFYGDGGEVSCRGEQR